MEKRIFERKILECNKHICFGNLVLAYASRYRYNAVACKISVTFKLKIYNIDIMICRLVILNELANDND